MNKKRTEIAELGEFGLIDRLTANFKQHHATTIKGVGDDAAVLAIAEDEELVMTTDSFFEGVDFDLTYFPLKHLGYKVVTAVVSDLAAMNARPRQLM
ncbi:MAG: thiamine-phosphate kinase, partial [Alistipes sp.]|nr:thiamine-phosphate kinase [Alistipes sp.]